jgi:hypothetical protein
MTGIIVTALVVIIGTLAAVAIGVCCLAKDMAQHGHDWRLL